MGLFDDTLLEALDANEETAVALQEAIASNTECIIDGIETYNDAVEVWNNAVIQNNLTGKLALLPSVGENVGYGAESFASIDSDGTAIEKLKVVEGKVQGDDAEANAKTITLILQANHLATSSSTSTVKTDIEKAFTAGHGSSTADALRSAQSSASTLHGTSGDVYNFKNELSSALRRKLYLAADSNQNSGLYKTLSPQIDSLSEALDGTRRCQEAIEQALEDYLESVENLAEEAADADGEEWDEAANAMSDGDTEALKEEVQNRQHVAPGAAAAEATERRYGVSPEFKEQCWLLSNIFDLARYKRNTLEKLIPKPLPYSTTTYTSREGMGVLVELMKKQSGGDFNACLMAHGDPYGFLNNLTQSPTQHVFFDMENKDISALQPQIRLYRINMDEDDSGQIKETEQEIFFASNYNPTQGVEELLVDKTKRGFGAGIKDFSFTYDGNNPFAVKKSISAKLNIFANSFDELLKDRGGYRYIDLALKTGTAKQGAEVEESMQQIIKDNLAKLNFRLKAVVGWALPKDSSTYLGGTKFGGATYKKDDINSAVNNSFVTLNLTPTIHEFKIDQMGRVNFIIDYFAYVEDFFEQPNFNVFFDAGILHKRVMRKLKYQTISSKGKCNAEDMAEIKKADITSNDVNWEKQESLRSIMKGLLTANKVNFINISHDDIENFNISGPYSNIGEFDVSEIKTDQSLALALAKGLEKEYADMAAADDETLDEEQFAKASIHPSHEQVSFFYISDLIDVILKGIDQTLSGMPAWLDPEAKNNEDNIKASKLWDKEISDEDLDAETKRFKKLYLNFKKLRVLLGPLEIINPADGGTSMFVNFGDVPISVKYFISWLTAKVLEKEETIYPLSVFLNDFFNNLVKEFLNNESCFDRGVKQATRLNQAVVTSYRNNGSQYDELTDLIREQIKEQKAASRVIVDEATAPLLNISGYRGIPGGSPSSDNFGPKEINYYTFFAGRTQPAEYMNGVRKEDEARGIFHYMLGKNRGIVKTINLSKTDAKFLKETRFEQEGYDGLEQLREVYDVEIETYANVKTFPGTYIFVDPHGFAPSTTSDEGTYDLTQYGIGGYCMIYRSTTTLGEGQSDTKISAKWVASIGAKGKTEIAKKEKAIVDRTCPEAESVRKEAKDDTGWWSSIIGG